MGATAVESGAACFLEDSATQAASAISATAAICSGVLGTHQITSAGFRAIERAISALEKVFGCLDPGLGKICDSDADGEAQRLAFADIEGVGLNLVAQALSEGDRSSFAGLRHRDDELIATVARNCIDAPSRAGKQQCD